MGTTLIFLASGEVVKKKIPVWIKYGERGKVKEQNLNIVYGKEGLFFGGGFGFQGEGRLDQLSLTAEPSLS